MPSARYVLGRIAAQVLEWQDDDRQTRRRDLPSSAVSPHPPDHQPAEANEGHDQQRQQRYQRPRPEAPAGHRTRRLLRGCSRQRLDIRERRVSGLLNRDDGLGQGAVRLCRHGRQETIAAPDHRLDTACAVAPLVQNTAQRGDLNRQVGVLNRQSGPSGCHQRLFGHHVSSLFGQGRQDVHRAGAEDDRLRSAALLQPEQAATSIHAEVLEPEDVAPGKANPDHGQCRPFPTCSTKVPSFATTSVRAAGPSAAVLAEFARFVPAPSRFCIPHPIASGAQRRGQPAYGRHDACRRTRGYRLHPAPTAGSRLDASS